MNYEKPQSEKSIMSRPGLMEWFFARRYDGESEYIYRLRLLQIISFTIFFAASFANYMTELKVSYIITSVTCLYLLLVRYFIDAGKPRTANYLLLLGVNIALFLLTCTEGVRSGVFLFYSVVVISFSFISGFSEKNDRIASYGVTSVFFLVSVILATRGYTIQTTELAASRINFVINASVSFILIMYISSVLMKDTKKMQVALENKHDFLEIIFNSSIYSETIIHVDTGVISDCNAESDRVFSKEGQPYVKGLHISGLFADSGTKEQLQFIKTLLTPGLCWYGEQLCKRVDNSVFPALVSIVAFKYDGADYKKITIVDITERSQILKDLQEAKQKAEESAQIKTQFLSQMSHELRTPLNGIIGTTNLLTGENILSHQEEHFNILKYSSEHMLSLINDILDLSKLEANKIQLEHIDTNVRTFISRLVAVFKPQFDNKGVALLSDIVLDVESVKVDSTRLKQVLSNLVSNALKFTTTGSVTISARTKSADSSRTEIEFSVRDTGIGISAENQELIFEQFSQADETINRRYGGTGLGLTISQKLIKLMSSDIQVQSTPGLGSRFYFVLSLPVSKAANENNDQQVMVNTMAPDVAAGLNILVAEDNAINMKIVSRFLDKWGIKHSKAKNGIEALQLFSKEHFDLLLLDLDMPEMNGYTALKEIRTIDEKVPAIAFTAAVLDHMEDKLAMSGFNDYIQKPFKPEDLQLKLMQYSQCA